MILKWTHFARAKTKIQTVLLFISTEKVSTTQ